MPVMELESVIIFLRFIANSKSDRSRLTRVQVSLVVNSRIHSSPLTAISHTNKTNTLVSVNLRVCVCRENNNQNLSPDSVLLCTDRSNQLFGVCFCTECLNDDVFNSATQLAEIE